MQSVIFDESCTTRPAKCESVQSLPLATPPNQHQNQALLVKYKIDWNCMKRGEKKKVWLGSGFMLRISTISLLINPTNSTLSYRFICTSYEITASSGRSEFKNRLCVCVGLVTGPHSVCSFIYLFIPPGKLEFLLTAPRIWENFTIAASLYAKSTYSFYVEKVQTFERAAEGTY